MEPRHWQEEALARDREHESKDHGDPGNEGGGEASRGRTATVHSEGDGQHYSSKKKSIGDIFIM